MYRLIVTIGFFVAIAACEPGIVKPTPQMAPTFHAIDPLTAAELQTGIEVLKNENLVGNGWFIQTMSTLEPDKTTEGMYPAVHAASDRKAFAVVLNLEGKQKLEVVVDLKNQRLESKEPIKKGEPALLFIEQTRAKQMVAKDERVIAAMQRRGLDMKGVHVEPWAAGDLSHEVNIDPTHRYIRTTFYYRNGAINPYARPIEGVTAIYDCSTNTVAHVADNPEIIPMQSFARDFFAATSQPKNPPPGFHNTHPNIAVSGQEVEWRGWKFRFQNHPREGLVIYDVRRLVGLVYEPVLERGSLSEMIVPYADSDPLWHWKSAFDEGEYGIGVNSSPLLRGIHFPVDGLSFPLQYASETGEITTIENSVAIWERFSGAIWSHYDYDTSTSAGRGGMELSIISFFTVGNYDYGINWVFKEDGSMDVQVLLTGVLLGKGSKTDQCQRCKIAHVNSKKIQPGDRFGMVIDKNIVAIAHQHFFNFRLDFAVGGGKNSLAKIQLAKAETDENTFGNSFLLEEIIRRTEKQSVDNVVHNNATHWWFYNRGKKNALGHYAGYTIDPGKTSDYFPDERSSVLRRAPFLKNNFYVTRFHPREMHAAGDYPSQNEGEGIPTWINSRDESIYEQDIVGWYTIGITHLPRAEEWPVMNAHKASFTMSPMGFYEHNVLVNLGE